MGQAVQAGLLVSRPFEQGKEGADKEKGHGFVIATFTATAIYGGIEKHVRGNHTKPQMVDPITYLGYVKRFDIMINIETTMTSGYDRVRNREVRSTD